jgi:hypothetical protein
MRNQFEYISAIRVRLGTLRLNFVCLRTILRIKNKGTEVILNSTFAKPNLFQPPKFRLQRCLVNEPFCVVTADGFCIVTDVARG